MLSEAKRKQSRNHAPEVQKGVQKLDLIWTELDMSSAPRTYKKSPVSTVKLQPSTVKPHVKSIRVFQLQQEFVAGLSVFVAHCWENSYKEDCGCRPFRWCHALGRAGPQIKQRRILM
jgi:hypothetical protein